jgi:hypothetical protein
MEQPLPIVFSGLSIVAALIAGLLKTGRWSLLAAAVAAGLATLGLVVMERLVVTPREEVRATLFVVADMLERNDADGVLGYVSAGRPQLRDEARLRMSQVEILEVRIKRNLKITVAAERGLEVAEARFNVVIRVRGRQGMLDSRPQPRFCVVNFRKEEDGRWRVRDYRLEDPRQGI